MQKREHDRHAIETAVVCSFLTAGSAKSVYKGRIVNFSSDGICVELNGDVKKGSLLMVRTTEGAAPAATLHGEKILPSVRIAVVRWSSDASEYKESRYFTGMQYVVGDYG